MQDVNMLPLQYQPFQYSIFQDNQETETADTEMINLFSDLYSSDIQFSNDLNGLLSILNLFDLKFDNYFDDLNNDVSEELINQRRDKNSKLVQTTRGLIQLHQELQYLLTHYADPEFIAVEFSHWCIAVVPYYKSYISSYKLNYSQPTTEVQIRRKPLIRIRFLNKVVLKLKELINYQDAKRHTAELLSSLEVANHKLTICLSEARRIDEQQRKKIDGHIHFNNVRSIHELAPIASHFDVSSILSSYDSELFYKNEKSDSLLSLNNIQLLFIDQSSKCSRSVAIVKIEDAGKSLIFPPLRTNELKFIKELEDDSVLLFKYCLDPKIEFYLKFNNDLELKAKLLQIFPSNVRLNDPCHKEIIDKHDKYDTSQTLGTGINVPKQYQARSILKQKSNNSLYHLQAGTLSAPSLPKSIYKDRFNLLSNNSNVSLPENNLQANNEKVRDFRISKDDFYNAIQEQNDRKQIDSNHIANSVLQNFIDNVMSDDEEENADDYDEIDIDNDEVLPIQRLEINNVSQSSIQSKGKENFDPHVFAKNYEHAFTKENSVSSLARQDSHESQATETAQTSNTQKKKRRQSILNVFSSLVNKKDTASTDSLHSIKNSKKLEATTSLNDKLIKPNKFITLTPKLEDLLFESSSIFLQDVKCCIWQSFGWSEATQVKLKLLISCNESYLAGFYENIPKNTNEKKYLVFLVKIESSTSIRKAGPLDLHCQSKDFSNNDLLVLIRSNNPDNGDKLLDILNMKKNGFISNSASEQSNLSEFSTNSVSTGNTAASSVTSLHNKRSTSSLRIRTNFTSSSASSIASPIDSSFGGSLTPTPTSLTFPKSIKINRNHTEKMKLMGNKKSKLVYQSLANVYKVKNINQINKQLVSLNKAILRIGDFQNKSYLQFLIKNTSIDLDLILSKRNFEKIDGKRIMINGTDYGLDDNGTNWYLIEFGKKVDTDLFLNHVNELF